MFDWFNKTTKESVNGNAVVEESNLATHEHFEKLLDEIHIELKKENHHSCFYKCTDSAIYCELKKQPAQLRANLCDWLVDQIHRLCLQFDEKTKDYQHIYGKFYQKQSAVAYAYLVVLKGLVRSKQEFTVEVVLAWIEKIDRDLRNTSLVPYYDWPWSFFIQQIERRAKSNPLNKTQITRLDNYVQNLPAGDAYSYGTDFKKLEVRIADLISAEIVDDNFVKSYKKLSGDGFGEIIEKKLKSLDQEHANLWNAVFHHANSADGGKPKKDFSAATAVLFEKYGKETIRRKIQFWLQTANQAKVSTRLHSQQYFRGDTIEYECPIFLTRQNIILVKGLVWMCVGFRDVKTVRLIADLCEKSMKKIPGQGPAAQATANACLWYLEMTGGVEATARLARLGTSIKQKNIQKRVKEIVAKKAKAAGITTIELEERVVPDFKLEVGVKTISFDDFTLRIEVKGPNSVLQTWIKPDGKPQKSKPASIAKNANLKTRFEKTKSDIVSLKKVLIAQRDRIDRLFAEDLSWPIVEIEDHYLNHGLVSVIARKLIWQITTNKKTVSAIFIDNKWQDNTGKLVKTNKHSAVRLWHPVTCKTKEVIAWRERLSELEIIQPTKQAYREVYVLTDAERATDVYSNRMAAHWVKQHQLATLMAARGWRYQLMGWYDDGIDDVFAIKTYVTSDLRAEFLIHTIFDDGENFNEAGIYYYVSTDQLRFVNVDGVPVSLETIPPQLFSEAMREADLFVGVTSVGNDPAWFDQGPTPEARNYWHGYSFGNLDAFAETRCHALKEILPKLNIKDKAHIEGKFLIVDGTYNTYKIHIGSSNILMAPGDRYLCIVPAFVRKSIDHAIALPFEGDTRLSVIISKAIMLANDDQIVEPSIVSQIKKYWE